MGFFRKKLSQARIQEFEAELPEHVRVKLSDRTKRISLRFDYKNRLFFLTMPPYADLNQADRFLASHEDWMVRKLNEAGTLKGFGDGEVITIWGETVQLRYDASLPARRLPAITNGELVLGGDPVLFNKRIVRFLKQEAKTLLAAKAKQKAALLKGQGAPLTKVTVKDTTSRWGSCTSDGAISFSWRMILAPEYVSDYLVAHEVAHLVHMDHSKSFWALCHTLCEQPVKAKNWLKKESKSLFDYHSG
jgi:predicted metal-dependent hydrolase